MYSRKNKEGGSIGNESYRVDEVIVKPPAIWTLLGTALRAADTGVLALVGTALGTALLLCAICARTR